MTSVIWLKRYTYLQRYESNLVHQVPELKAEIKASASAASCLPRGGPVNTVTVINYLRLTAAVFI